MNVNNEFINACAGRKIQQAKTLYESNEFDQTTLRFAFNYAIMNGRVDVIKFLRYVNAPYEEQSMSWADERGNWNKSAKALGWYD